MLLAMIIKSVRLIICTIVTLGACVAASFVIM
jgi:hypothetical protein